MKTGPFAEVLTIYIYIYIYIRSVARKETLDVHLKNWVCHIYCQINAKISMLIGY